MMSFQTVTTFDGRLDTTDSVLFPSVQSFFFPQEVLMSCYWRPFIFSDTEPILGMTQVFHSYLVDYLVVFTQCDVWTVHR